MLFDAEGKELSCNKGYFDFELGSGQGDDSEDFMRLLKGVPSIIHPANKDPLTGLDDQIIGVTMRDDHDQYGALIMALPQGLINRSQGDYSGMTQLGYLIDLSTAGNIYFSLNAEDGIIRNSSDMNLIDTPAENYGIDENARKSGYMGFIVISGTRYYAVSMGQGSEIYYYAVPLSEILRGILPYGLITSGCFILMYAAAVLIMLTGYRENAYLSQLAQTMEAAEEEEPLNSEDLQEQAIHETTEERKSLWRRWREQTPEMKERTLFRVMFFVIILASAAYVLLNMNQMKSNGGSLLSFILFGNWMRSFNLFSITRILMLIALIYVIVVVVKWILQLLTGFLGTRAETVCRLMNNVVHYIAVLAGLYFALEYLGFQLSTILAGLGIVGVAVSFGAKDMIADIFAGLSIVFEGAFRVGEMVRLKNFEGRVESIGIRMTKIVSRDNSMMIINNKDIKEMINLSRLTSWVTVNIRISLNQSLTKVREILEKELPVIGQNSELIIKGPVFLGVRETNGSVGTLTVTAECRSKDFGKTQAYLTEELVELLKQKEITIQ